MLVGQGFHSVSIKTPNSSFCLVLFQVILSGSLSLIIKLKSLMVVEMGLIGRLKWVDGSKKQCRSLFWRARAAVKKAVKNNGGKQNVKFQYDPSSYALNFDDGGCCHLGEGRYEVKSARNVDGNNKAIWVYVVWVESEC